MVYTIYSTPSRIFFLQALLVLKNIHEHVTMYIRTPYEWNKISEK